MLGLHCINLISLFLWPWSRSSHLTGSGVRFEIENLTFVGECLTICCCLLCVFCISGVVICVIGVSNYILRTYVTGLSMMPVVVLSFNNNAIRVPCTRWYHWIDVYLRQNDVGKPGCWMGGCQSGWHLNTSIPRCSCPWVLWGLYGSGELKCVFGDPKSRTYMEVVV